MPKLVVGLLAIEELRGYANPIKKETTDPVKTETADPLNTKTTDQKRFVRTVVSPKTPYDMAGKEFLMIPLKCISTEYTGEVTIVKAKAVLLQQTKRVIKDKKTNKNVTEYVTATSNPAQPTPWAFVILQPHIPMSFKDKNYVLYGPITGDVKDIFLKPKGKGIHEKRAEIPRKSTKRSRFDGSAPSPSGILNAKQSEGLEEGGAFISTKETYRESLTTYKMAVIPENVPTNNLLEEQIEKLQESVVEAFENLKDWNFPQFTISYEKRDALILSCANEATIKWVMGRVPELKPWEGGKLTMGPRAKILRTTKVLFKTPKMFAKTDPKIIKMIKDQNKNLSLGDWKIISSRYILLFPISCLKTTSSKFPAHFMLIPTRKDFCELIPFKKRYVARFTSKSGPFVFAQPDLLLGLEMKQSKKDYKSKTIAYDKLQKFELNLGMTQDISELIEKYKPKGRGGSVLQDVYSLRWVFDYHDHA
ncbi:hypothetical protein C0J52_02773 [Blattella germanica]|nr:hypothetical protein C0J52_02773 [Blattella germanica]